MDLGQVRRRLLGFYDDSKARIDSLHQQNLSWLSLTASYFRKRARGINDGERRVSKRVKRVDSEERKELKKKRGKKVEVFEEDECEEVIEIPKIVMEEKEVEDIEDAVEIEEVIDEVIVAENSIEETLCHLTCKEDEIITQKDGMVDVDVEQQILTEKSNIEIGSNYDTIQQVELEKENNSESNDGSKRAQVFTQEEEFDKIETKNTKVSEPKREKILEEKLDEIEGRVSDTNRENVLEEDLDEIETRKTKFTIGEKVLDESVSSVRDNKNQHDFLIEKSGFSIIEKGDQNQVERQPSFVENDIGNNHCAQESTPLPE